jgi:hypothetical protein
MNSQTKSDLKIIAHEVFTGILLVVALFALLFLTGCAKPPVSSYVPPLSQQLILDKQVASLTRNEIINGVTECEGAGLRAHVITTKRLINGFSADIPIEVTCMPKFKY